jgi:hypothetical protein
MAVETGVQYVEVTVASGAAVSSAAQLKGRRLTGILWPATMSNAAGDIQGSRDNGATWFNISTLAAIPTTASTLVSLDPADTVCAHYVRLNFTGGNEGGARTVVIVSQPTV